MRYHPDDFVALDEEVNRQGGASLTDTCVGTTFRLKVPMATGKREWKEYHTAACGFAARYVIPYDSVVDKAGTGLLTACAVDDAMGMWPRFAGVVSDQSYLAGLTLPEEFE